MTDARTIPALVDALDAPTVEAVAALLPPGPQASDVVAQLADEAERRIMADLSRAVRTTAALTELADAHATPVVRARVRRVAAQALTYANRFDEAMTILSQALSLAESDAVEAGRIQLAMLHVFARQGRFDDAIACGLRGREAFERAGERTLLGRAENNLGILERMRDKPAEAIPHFERASKELASEPPLLAHVENNRAEALLDLDRFAEAEAAFRAALAAFRAASASRHAGIVLGNLADLASRQGRLHEALAMFEEARRVLDEASAPGDAARLAIEHADVLTSLGMLPLAIRAYEQAIPVLQTHKMTAEGARAQLGLGRALAKAGSTRATAVLADAEAAFKDLKNDSARARALALRADLAALTGDFAHATQLLAQAGTAVHDRPAARAWVDLLTADVQLRAGDAAGAESTAAQAAGVAESLGVMPLAADLLQLRGRALRASGDVAEAARVLRRAVQHAERCRGALQTDRFRSAFLGDRAGIWEECASAVLDVGGAGATAEAFTLIEMSKSRSLLDVLSRPEASRPITDDDDALARDYAQVTGELGALYARAHDASDASTPAMERLRSEIASREARADALVVRLGAVSRYAGAFAVPARLPEVVASVPDDGAIIEYFAEGDRISAIIIQSGSRGGATIVRQFASAHAVRDAASALMFQIGRALARGLPGGERGERLARDAEAELDALGSLVLGPVMQAVAGRSRLVIVPTGPLHAIPFPALSTGGPGTPRLLELAETAVSPSVSVLERIAPPVLGRGELVMGVADERAPRSEIEAQDVAACLHAAVVLTGPGATREAFFQRCGSCSHLHLACHARFIPSNPEASGLKLSDGWITAHEITRAYLSGASVLLSGCDTGRASSSGGDEQMGLARAVLSAGASSVTTTLWPVHDASTAELMGSAYRSMAGAGGSSVRIGAALLAAQREKMKSGAHAAAWAPFVTVYRPW